MINNTNIFTYDVFIGTGKTVTLKKSISECISKETTQVELEQICLHFNTNSIAQLPEQTTRPDRLNFDMILFTHMASSAIEVKNNKLLYYIVSKIIKYLDDSQRKIIFNKTLDNGFILIDKESQFYAYHTIRKLIPRMCIPNEFNVYNRAVETENVALICLLIKNGAKIYPRISKTSLSQMSKLKLELESFENLRFQLKVKNDFIEKALLGINLELTFQRFSIPIAKLIVEYTEGNWLHDSHNRNVFVKFVIETITSPFPNELNKIIQQYEGCYDEEI